MRVAKTKGLICAFVFAYAKCWFSHDTAQMRHLKDHEESKTRN